MYNQNYIDTIGEKELNHFLLTGQRKYGNKEIPYKLDITNNRMNDINFYYTLENYLVKCMKEKIYVNKAADYINNIYKDFQKYPYLFVNSPLLKDKNIEMLFQKNNDADIVKGYRNKYFSLTILIELSKKDNLTEEEKNRYYSTLIHNINNDKIKDIVENEIKKIIDKKEELKIFNKMELQFYSQYVANYSNEIKDKNVIVFVGSDEESKRGYHNAGMVFLNKDAKTNLPIFTKTICHEVQHFKQVNDAKLKINVEAYEMASRYLFSKYLDSANYSSYRKNYKYSGIEIDAEKIGHHKAGVFFTMYQKNDLAEMVRKDRRDTVDRRYYYNFMYDENNNEIPTDSFYVRNFDKIINNNIEELNNFPILNEFYNKEGKRKNLLELLESKKTKMGYERPIYDNFINYAIRHNELETIDLNKMDNTKVNGFGYLLASSFKDYVYNIKNYFDDVPNLKEYIEKRKQEILNNPNFSDEEKRNKINDLTNEEQNIKTQIIYTTRYQILLAKTVAAYTLKNYDKLMVNYGKKLNKVPEDYFFNFIIQMRDFNYNDIKNPILKNDISVLNSLKELKQLTDELTKKYNYYFTYGRLKELPDEIINGPGPYNTTFGNYILGISTKLNGHQKLIHNGKEYYIGDIIRSYNPEEFDESQKKAML